ncbi:hypothetical protein, partial [Parachitinimonas caeni]
MGFGSGFDDGHCNLPRYAAGRLIAQTNSEGQNLRYAYYSNGYLMAVADQNESSRSLTEYAYDRDGNRT